jgi:hypothetical protein
MVQKSLGILEWRNGGRRDFWIVNAVNVGKFISANKIKPISQEALHMRAASPEASEKMMGEELRVLWWWKNGGIRAPHLHFNGDIYLLNKNQWKTFSKDIIENFSNRLAEANSINFGQLMDLADTMDEII